MPKKAQPGNEIDDDTKRGPDNEAGDDDSAHGEGEGQTQGGDSENEGTGGDLEKGKDDSKPKETVEQAIAKSLGLGEDTDADKKGDEPGKEKPKGDGEDKGAEGKKAGDKDGSDKEKGNKGGKGKADPYAVPEDLKPKAQARFQELVHVAKEKDNTITQQTEIISGFRDMVKATGATDKQFLESLDVLTMINKSPAEAAKRLYDAACELALAYNVDIPGIDFLKDYEDLSKQVEAGEITPQAAREVANSRRSAVLRENQAAATRQTEERQKAEKQALDTGVNQIDAFLKDKETNDIDFNAKAEELGVAAQYAAENLAPDKWLGYMQMEYNRVTKLLAKGYRPADNGGSNRPLRPGGNKGGKTAPTTDVDAVKAALGLEG